MDAEKRLDKHSNSCKLEDVCSLSRAGTESLMLIVKLICKDYDQVGEQEPRARQARPFLARVKRC